MLRLAAASERRTMAAIWPVKVAVARQPAQRISMTTPAV